MSGIDLQMVEGILNITCDDQNQRIFVHGPQILSVGPTDAVSSIRRQPREAVGCRDRYRVNVTPNGIHRSI